MAFSKISNPAGLCYAEFRFPEYAPGPFGIQGEKFRRDSPGTLGANDWAEFTAHALTFPAAPVIGYGCACNRDLTLNELCRVFSKQKRKVCELYQPHINATFKKYDIGTCLRKAHFLAQVGHESGELRYTAEILPNSKTEADVYDGYKGRGLIQITWGKNYKAYGKAVQHDFTGDNKSQLEDPEWATDSAGWYWTSGSGKDLNELADKNDLLAISARVNGGFNGFEDRRVRLLGGFDALLVRTCKAVGIGDQAFLPFAESAIYDNRVYAFGWGCWNDPKSGKRGVIADPAERKSGYARYLELRAEEEKAHKKEGYHYGYSPDQMKTAAKEGSK